MTARPARPVLVTGASGALGRQVTAHLGGLGWPLVLTDIAPFPDPIPAGSRFVAADLEDGVAILRLAEGCGTILHFGGVSTEQPFETVLGPNIRGAYHIYEAARRERARVLFASSNHAIGFHEVTEPLDADCALMPDSYYGLSKAYTELMGRMYWMRHGVENVNVRIGSSYPEPANARHLATWLSYADLARLCERATLAEATGHCVIWGASANSRTYWRGDARARLGWLPRDSADDHAGKVGNIVAEDPLERRYQGGPYPVMEYSRAEPAPPGLFALPAADP
jgi:uronate dehydrogenase